MASAMEHTSKKSGYDFWQTCLGGAKAVVAPMVDQSELAWRMLSRQYGAELCYTPMLHASVFRRNHIYRRENFKTCPEDRPLIVQFCANDPLTLLESARYVEKYSDAVDLNLGCPQTIARKGHYGAFLQDDWDLIFEMVSLLHRELSIPVTCKIRVFDDIPKTVEYAKMLESAGCQLLTVHGRTRNQKGPYTGLASWKHIKAIKDNLKIPVFANGNIQFLEDMERCLLETGVDGVMSAEGNLYNPALFTGQQPPCWEMVEEYLKWVEIYTPSVSIIRGHLFKLWHHVLQNPNYCQFRIKIATAKTLETLKDTSLELKYTLLSNLTDEELKTDYTLSNLPFWRCQPYIRPNPEVKRSRSCDTVEDSERKIRKRLRQESKRASKTGEKKQWISCAYCKGNPKGLRCVNGLCKNCCKVESAQNTLDCPGHHLLFKTKSLLRSQGIRPKSTEEHLKSPESN